MKNHLLRLVMLSVAIVLSFTTGAFAKVEWEILKNITLEDTPRDIAISKDGSSAYILCSNGIQIYSTRTNTVTGNIPLKDGFSHSLRTVVIIGLVSSRVPYAIPNNFHTCSSVILIFFRSSDAFTALS